MKKKWIKYVLGVLVTVLALWLSFRKLDWNALQRSFLQVNVFWVGAALFCTLFAVYALGWRWHMLLKSKVKLPMLYMFKLNVISQYLNIVIPGRFGEIAKAWLPAKQYHMSGSYVLGTVLIEKMFDFISWVLLWLTIPAFFVFHDDIEAKGYKMALIVSVVLIVLMVLVVWKKEMVRRWVHFFAGVLPVKFQQRLVNFLDRGLDAFGLLKNFQTSLVLVLYTALIILLSSLSNFLLFKAFGFDLTLFQAMVLWLVIQMGSAPPSIPGRIGIFEYMTILGLSLFGINKTDALGYGLMLHLVSYLPKIILGFVFMTNLNLTVKNAETEFSHLNGMEEMERADETNASHNETPVDQK